MGIGVDEYRARQEAARRAAAEAGLDCLVAWSRGGSAQDGYADVYHLTGFYQHQPLVPDLPGRWRAEGHAAAVVPVEGPVVLVSNVGELQEEPVADEVRPASDLVDTLADVVRRAVPDGGRAGLTGCAGLAWPWRDRLAAGLPGRALVDADEVGWRLRRVKSPAELDLLRAAGALGVRAMDAAMAAAVPGASEAEVAAAAIGEIVAGGGAYYGMGLSSGGQSVTFAPSGPAAYTGRRLEAGDLLRIDLYGSVEGYLFDFARTRVVAGEAGEDRRLLLDAVRDSVRAGVAALRPGTPLSEVARRCDENLARSPYTRRHGAPRPLMSGVWGHGLGLSFEPPWLSPDVPGVAEPGMCLAVERRIALPGVGGANYEDNVIVTESGPEVITPAAPEYLG
ncbi:M24 family metallopeptidase [Bailinhaonella thermotolerans]|uniref:Aminopeptidase P family protein n=1 Tax=Bailinhaonella thermotolerans TaxID=1070861 RepID=A0A3A4AFC2_9ACTN|nr:M24 family metallopeptidase [Bailinhaonella thermotolerans]RJL24710.1 aminopeptidase P family protein [Bailinhaonella thermotolerans]